MYYNYILYHSYRARCASSLKNGCGIICVIASKYVRCFLVCVIASEYVRCFLVCLVTSEYVRCFLVRLITSEYVRCFLVCLVISEYIRCFLIRIFSEDVCRLLKAAAIDVKILFVFPQNICCLLGIIAENISCSLAFILSFSRDQLSLSRNLPFPSQNVFRLQLTLHPLPKFWMYGS